MPPSAAVGENFGAAFKMVHDNSSTPDSGGRKGGEGKRKWKLQRTDEVVDFEEMFLGDEEEKARRITMHAHMCTLGRPLIRDVL